MTLKSSILTLPSGHNLTYKDIGGTFRVGTQIMTLSAIDPLVSPNRAIMEEPYIGTTVTASSPATLIFGPDSTQAGFGAGDTITFRFDVDTNQPQVTYKANLTQMFDFSASLGNDFTGVWFLANTLIITIVDPINAGALSATRVGALSATVKRANANK